MGSNIPNSHRDLLDGAVIAALATLMPNRQIQSLRLCGAVMTAHM